MKAMILDEHNNFLYTDVPMPQRKSGEILMKTAAAAINRADLMQKDGLYASPEGWPQWCGLEAAGTVVEADVGSRFKIGDKVTALLGGGGYSEYCSVPEEMVLPVPKGLTMEEAAALPEVWATVYINFMTEAGGVGKDDLVYIQAGASGVGLAAIQLAKHFGANVVATAGSPEKVEHIRKLGADYSLDYHNTDMAEFFKTHNPTIALDCIGGRGMGACLANMAFKGRWIMIASMAGGETSINLETIWRKRIKLIGSTLRSRTNKEKGECLRALERDLWPLFSSGALSPSLYKVFPIVEVESAHAVLRRNENIGKVVLSFGE